jgi:hypothetical protein
MLAEQYWLLILLLESKLLIMKKFLLKFVVNRSLHISTLKNNFRVVTLSIHTLLIFNFTRRLIITSQSLQAVFYHTK